MDEIRGLACLLALTLFISACTRPATDTTASSEGSRAPSGSISPPPPAPIAPVLRLPGQQGEIQAGSPVDLGVMVLAQNDIARVELWGGGGMEASLDLESPTTDLRTSLPWTPSGAGLHGLTLRAFDAEGGVATSFPLWVRAIDPGPVSAMGAASGETASRLGSGSIEQSVAYAVNDPAPPDDECEVELNVPGTELDGTIVYAAVLGGGGFVPIEAIGPEGGTVDLSMGASPVMVYQETFTSTEQNPGPPQLLIPPEPCWARGWSGDLVMEDGVLTGLAAAVESAYLYVSADQGSTWRRAPAADQTFVYPGANGAFDFSSVLPPTGDEVVVFEAWGWIDGDLEPLGRGSWDPGGLTADVPPGSSLVPGIGGTLVAKGDLDWIVDEEVPVLARTGTICTYPLPQVIPKATTTVPISVIGGTTATPTTQAATPAIGMFPDTCANAPYGAIPETFRWEPVFGSYDMGLVQVSTKPIPSGPVAAFPGLVYTASVSKPASGPVEIEIPLGDILDPPPAEAFEPGAGALTFTELAHLLLPGSGSGDALEQVSFVLPPGIGGLGTPMLYIRVVPATSTGQLLPGESNVVEVKIDDTSPPGKLELPPPPSSISVEVTMSPPLLPNPAYERCVRVVDNPFGSKNPAPSTTPFWFLARDEPVPAPNPILDARYSGMESLAFIFEGGSKVHDGMITGSTVCAWQADPPSKQWWEYIEDAFEFVGWVWDQYVTVWDKLKGWVADVMAHVSGCVALAEGTGKSESEAEAACSGFAKTAIDYALIAYGVPPTLPKFADFAELAKGELKEFLIEQAFDQTGIDCSVLQDECEEMLEELLDEMIDEMELAASKAAVQASTVGSQWVMAIHPAIKVVPEPAGGPPTALFTVEVTRSSDPKSPPPPAHCTYTAGVWGDKADYGWQNYDTNQWQTGPIEGQVMVPNSVTIELGELGPGESVVAPIVLDQIADFYLPGQNPYHDPVPWNSGGSKAWIFFVDYGVDASTHPLTTLTLGVSGGPGCGGASSVFAQDHSYAEPWKVIPYP